MRRGISTTAGSRCWLALRFLAPLGMTVVKMRIAGPSRESGFYVLLQSRSISAAELLNLCGRDFIFRCRSHRSLRQKFCFLPQGFAPPAVDVPVKSIEPTLADSFKLSARSITQRAFFRRSFSHSDTALWTDVVIIGFSLATCKTLAI